MRTPSSSPTGGRESPRRWTHWPACCLSRRTGSGPHRRRLRHENRRQTPDEVRMRLGTRINNPRTRNNSPSEKCEWLPTLSTALVGAHTSRARSGWPGVSSTRGIWDEDVDPSSTMRMSPRGSRGSGGGWVGEGVEAGHRVDGVGSRGPTPLAHRARMAAYSGRRRPGTRSRNGAPAARGPCATPGGRVHLVQRGMGALAKQTNG